MFSVFCFTGFKKYDNKRARMRWKLFEIRKGGGRLVIKMKMLCICHDRKYRTFPVKGLKQDTSDSKNAAY